MLISEQLQIALTERYQPLGPEVQVLAPGRLKLEQVTRTGYLSNLL